MYLRYLAFNRKLPNRYNVPQLIIWDAIKKANKLGFKRICMGSTPINQDNPTYRLKRSFGASYEYIYSVFVPTSKFFNFGYKFYNITNGIISSKGII